MKKIFVFLFIAVFMLSFASAFELDNVVEFDSKYGDYGKATIKNVFGFGDAISEIVLEKNSEVCVDNLCYAEGKTTLYNNGKLIDSLRFIGDKDAISSYTVYLMKESRWVEYNGGILSAGEYGWRIEGQISPGKTADWIGSWSGKEVKEWAIWTSEYQIRVWATSAVEARIEINNVILTDEGGGVFKLNTTESNYEVARAQIMKTLFYGASGSDPRVLNFTGITDMFSADIRDYNKSGFYESILLSSANNNGVLTLNLAFTSTTNNDDVSSWSYVRASGGSSFSKWEIPTSTIRNSVVSGSNNELGVDTSGDQVNNPATAKINMNIRIGVAPMEGRVIILSNSNITYSVSDTGGESETVSTTNFFDEYSIPRFLTIPTATANAPSNNTSHLVSRDIVFNVSATATASNLDNASLYIDDSLVATNDISGASDTTTFSESISVLGDHNWYFLVCDSNNNCDKTTSRTLTINPVAENSQTYPTVSIESATETYTANVTYNSSDFSIISGVLTLNETEYSGTKIGTGDTIVFSADVLMPSITTETNLTAYWTMSLTNITGTFDYNLTSHNVTVSIINLSLCDGSNNVPFWNFTILNETNLVEINSTFEVTFAVRSNGSPTNNYFSFADVTGTNSQFDFCISPGTAAYDADASIKLTKSGFVDKFYNYESVSLTNTTREDNLYMMTSDDSTSFIIHTVYTNAQDIAGAEVQVQRYYPGTNEWLTTEILTTNDVGTAVGHILSEDADYRFLVYLDGVSIHNSSATKIVCAVTPCTVTLVVPIVTGTGYELLEDVTSTLVFSNNIFTYTYSDSSGSFTQARLYVIRLAPSNSTLVIPCDDTKTDSSGVLTCDISGQINGTYQATGYITRGGDELFDKRVNANLGTRIYDSFGIDGVLWSIFIFIAIVMIGINRPSSAIIFGIVGFIVLALMNIINIGAISIVSIVAIGIILLWLVGKE